MPSNSLLLGSLEQLEQRVRRPGSERDVEEDPAGGRCKATATMLVDEHTDLLVARPDEAQVACQGRNPTVHLGDRDRIVVESLDRREQRWTDARCGD